MSVSLIAASLSVLIGCTQTPAVHLDSYGGWEVGAAWREPVEYQRGGAAFHGFICDEKIYFSISEGIIACSSSKNKTLTYRSIRYQYNYVYENGTLTDIIRYDRTAYP